MAECFKTQVAEAPVDPVAAEEQLIRSDYYSNRDDSVEGDEGDSSGSENEEQTATKSFIEPREIDSEEQKVIKEFCSTTCKCSKRKGGPCSAYFSIEALSEYRMQMLELRLRR